MWPLSAIYVCEIDECEIDPFVSPNIADIIMLQLADTATTFSVQFTQKSILSTSGNASFSVPATYPGNGYFLIIKHRNALETWSSVPVILAPGMTYDFTNAINKAYGNNLSFLCDGNFAIFSGDISDTGLGQTGFQDSIIESQDYIKVENAVSIVAVGYIPQDITGDGIVESADYSIMENNVSAILFVKKS